LAGVDGTRWALVLGASSGFGEACSLALARAASGSPGLPERQPVPAAAVEPIQRA